MLNATLNTKTAGNHTLDSRFCAPQHDCGQGGAGASAAAAATANVSLEVALSMYFGEATVDLGFAFAEAAGAAAPMLVQCPLQASTGTTLNLIILATAYRDNRTIISGDTCPSGSMMADGVAEAATQNSIAQVMVAGGTRTFSISVGGITNAVYR